MALVKRKVLDKIRPHLEKPEITVITGPRQCGKTTIMKILETELTARGNKTLFMNLDVEEDMAHFSSQNNLLRKIELEIGSDGYVFIDEIQRKENAGRFLKGIYDMDRPYKFIVSGSGSIELKEDLQESLAGRKRIFEVSTISFEEFVNYRTDYRYDDKLENFFEIEKAKTLSFLEEYLNFGGYPRVILEQEAKEKREIIREIYQSYIERDITYLLRLARPEEFSLLVRFLSLLAGKIVNFSSLSSEVGISIKTGELPPPIEAGGFVVNTPIGASFPTLKGLFHPQKTNHTANFTKFFAAFISLSCLVPHFGHCHSLMAKFFTSGFLYPHSLHI